MTILGRLLDAGGKLIGWAEMHGLEYPVDTYMFKVSNNLWRGSRLSDASAYARLKSMGITCIISLLAENNNDAEPADAVGLLHVRIPIMDNTAPTEEQMFWFLEIVNHNPNTITYVHCTEGKGRTGVAVACQRMAIENWPLDDALAEAKKFGLKFECQKDFLKEFWLTGVAKWKAMK